MAPPLPAATKSPHLLTFTLTALAFCAPLSAQTDIAELMKQAQSNDAQAQYLLGACYYKGEGVPHDSAEAFKWFMRAAGQNYPDAQTVIGLFYLYGEGIEKNRAEGIKRLEKAAKKWK